MRVRNHFTAVLCLWLLFGLRPVWAGPDEQYEAAASAWSKKDYEHAVSLLKPLAEAGHSKAQAQLGHAYRWGASVENNPEKAAYWYRKAAEQGDAWAQFQLGTLYDGGIGVTKDASEAAKWFLKSAESGYYKAQYNVASMHATGEGLRQDWLAAHVWFSLAASNGNKRARLGMNAAAKHLTPEQLSISEELVRTLGRHP